MEYYLTWNKVSILPSIESIEDPIMSSMTDKTIFYETYKQVLDELDGQSMADHFDFFFEPSPLNNTYWIFKDEVLKEDFIDWCIELGIINTIKEIKCGKTDIEYNNRQKYIEKQKIKLGEKKKKYKLNKEFKKMEQMLKTYKELMEKLKKYENKDNLSEIELKEKEKIIKKLEKIIPQLDNTI